MATVLSIDFGTSSVKAGLIDHQGRLVWSSGSVFPQIPSYENWQTNQWLYSLEQIFGDFSDARNNRAVPHPDAIAVSGNGPTLVALGSDFQQGRRANWPVLLWMNAPDLSIPGNPSFYLPKVHYERQHNPQRYEATTCYISGPEYISWLLSGELCTISPSEEFTRYIWDESQFLAYDLSPGLFPDVIGLGKVIGSIDRTGSRLSGLLEGTPVVSAGSDFLMSLLGTAAVSPGVTCDRAGTSEGINCCIEQPINHPALRVLPHAIEGLYNAGGILSSTGRMFEWFRTITHQRETSYQQMMQGIREVRPEVSGPWFYPTLQADQCWDFKGGMFSELQPEHNSAHLGRAVVEAIGFSIRANIEYLEESGCSINSMRSCGGQAKNDSWCQMKADITGTTIEVPVIRDAELCGCASMGFLGLGMFSNSVQASVELVTIEKRYEPDMETSDILRSKYLAWRSSYDYIRNAASHLSGSAGER